MDEFLKFGQQPTNDEQLKKFKAEQKEETVEVIRTQHVTPGDLNLGNIVVRNAAVVMKNLITTQPIKGIEDNKDSAVQALLERSEFFKIPPKLEMALSFHTGQALMTVVYVSNIPYIVQMDGWVNKIGKTVTYAIGWTNNRGNYGKGYEDVALGYEWKLNDQGRPMVRTIMQIESAPSNFLPTPNSVWHLLPDGHKFIPVTEFSNTEETNPDWWYVGSLVKHLNFHSNETVPEWQFSKVQYMQNGNFSDSGLPSSIRNAILGGERIHTTGGIASKLREPLEVFMAGSGTMLTNGLQIDSLEDKLHKYLFTLRDSIASGTNKHNTEVATFNQVATDMALFKMTRFRDPSWTQFFKDHVGAIKNIKVDKAFKAKTTISEIERNKIDTGKPEPKTNTGAPKTASGTPKVDQK